jgi:di/tricarboxylate transporter
LIITASAASPGAEQQATIEQLAGVFMLMAGLLVLAMVVVFFEYCGAATIDSNTSNKKRVILIVQGNLWNPSLDN